jgi:hypothetical protein
LLHPNVLAAPRKVCLNLFHLIVCLVCLVQYSRQKFGTKYAER